MSLIPWSLKRYGWQAAVLAVAAAPLLAIAQPPSSLRHVQATCTPKEVAPGQSFTLTVDLTIPPGLHLQAHEPLQDYLIGTELNASQVPGVAWGQPNYPSGDMRNDQLLGTLLEYVGNIQIRLPGQIGADAEPGTRDVQLTLRYQACNEQGSCFPPQTIPIQATVQILPGYGTAEASAGEPGTPTATLPDVSTPAAGTAQSATPAAGRAPASSKAPASQQGARFLWQPFTTQRLAELTAAGKTVLIDFTADWCPNCKLNEYLALNTEATADLVYRNNVVPLLADFTREDPEIRRWLARFNSISVPLTVILPAGNPDNPIILRDTYRQSTLISALKQAGPSLTSAASRPGLTLDTPLRWKEPASPAWWYLLAAFIGGFILNFMPCVLPVISIKILSLVSQAGQSPRRVLGLGLSFAGGMIFLFLVLGVLVTVAGQTWGGLFQSTTFLLVMLGILVAMTASLFGAFTFGVPAVVGDADVAIEGEGYAASFGKGILAVLLGTPCSGPFLGSALAWAAAKSASGQAYLGMLIFLSMGVGMALPFVVLAARPNWMRFIPRPGAWMETFKQLMGFLLLLTVVYILSILEASLVKWAVLFAFGVAFASWLYGRLVRPNHSAVANWMGRAIAVLVLVAFTWLSFVGFQGLRQGSTNSLVEKAGTMVE